MTDRNALAESVERLRASGFASEKAIVTAIGNLGAALLIEDPDDRRAEIEKTIVWAKGGAGDRPELAIDGYRLVLIPSSVAAASALCKRDAMTDTDLPPRRINDEYVADLIDDILDVVTAAAVDNETGLFEPRPLESLAALQSVIASTLASFPADCDEQIECYLATYADAMRATIASVRGPRAVAPVSAAAH